jgi:hypothetical protein
MRPPSPDALDLAGELLAALDGMPEAHAIVQGVLMRYAGERAYIRRTTLGMVDDNQAFAEKMTRAGVGRDAVQEMLRERRGLGERQARRLASDAAVKFQQGMSVPPVKVDFHDDPDHPPGPRR